MHPTQGELRLFPNLSPEPKMASNLDTRSETTAPAPGVVPSLRALVRSDANGIIERLAQHRLASFPPEAAKTFRRLTPGETARILGVTEAYLRQLMPPASVGERRQYALEDLAAIRKALDAKPRSVGKYLPGRKPGEPLQVIAVMNFKGGSGKTTTTAHLAQYLALRGYRVLAVDLDPQASLTGLFGLRPEIDVPAGGSFFGAIRHSGEQVPMRSIVKTTYMPGLDLVPAALELMEYEFETPHALMRAQGSNQVFSRAAHALREIEGDYDVVVIDCPPQLGYLSISALVAATSVLVTVHPQMLDVASLGQFMLMLGDLLDVIAGASGGVESSYDWMRYLITRFEPGDGPQTQMLTLLRSMFGERILIHPTLKSTAISDAGLTNQTLFEVSRSQFIRSTYDRAMESIENVNGEIEALIRKAWGRPT